MGSLQQISAVVGATAAAPSVGVLFVVIQHVG